MSGYGNAETRLWFLYSAHLIDNGQAFRGTPWDGWKTGTPINQARPPSHRPFHCQRALDR
jgi:hypothetical protein